MDVINQLFGVFAGFSAWAVIVSILIVAILYAYMGAPLWLWAVSGFAALWGAGAPLWFTASYLVLCLIFNIKCLFLERLRDE